MPETPDIYCKSALFTCTCCGYATDIYSYSEWLESTIEEICKNCEAKDAVHYGAGLIYRHDVGDEGVDIPLHPQCARLPVALQTCVTCINRTEVHWTEIVVCCNKCDSESMVFTKYSIGKNILLFYEYCIDSAKPSYPSIEWTDKSGFQYFELNGPGSSFSAT
jgi:hypothetical protein